MIETLSRFVEQLAAENFSNPYNSVPIYLLAGLLSSLFPCVYPLIPITAGYLRSRAEQDENPLKHPLLYWLGTVLTYGLLGVLAAASGGAFNKIARSGVTLVVVGFLFLFLAFAALDWFSLSSSMTSRLYDRAGRKKGALFTLLMGALTALLASACVAPVLVTMLVMLAQEAAASGVQATSLFHGGLLSLSFGMGVATPLLLIALFGIRLPRSGPWGQYIKIMFAIAIAIAGLYEISTGFTLLGFSQQQIFSVLGGMALLFLAVFIGLLPPSPQDRRASVKFYFSLLALAFGLAFIINGITIQRTETEPTTGEQQQVSRLDRAKDSSVGNSAVPSAGEAKYELIGKLRFYRQYEYAKQLAKEQDRPIFIDFYGEWCSNCKEFNRQVESDPRLQQALAPAILVKIYDTDPDFQQFARDPLYPELRIGLPFFAILNPDSSLRWKTTNHKDISGMAKAISANLAASTQ